MVIAAARCGFGLVKFQAYRTEEFLHRESPYFRDLKREELQFKDLAELARVAKGQGLKFGLTVFGQEGIDLAGETQCDYVKISSGDITNLPLLRKAANSCLPLVVSTGASTEAESMRALEIAGKSLAAILQCSSLYPAPEPAVNLAVMDAWLQRGLKAGLSDHSLSIEPMKWAYLLGAAMIEKHFTLDRNLPGGDNDISLDPAGMARLIACLQERGAWGQESGPTDRAQAIGAIERMPFWGQPGKTIQPGENQCLIRRHAVAARNLKKGQTLTPSLTLFQRLSPQALKWGPTLGPDRDLSALRLVHDIPAHNPIYIPDVESFGSHSSID
jgi:sialic acid synthase SpsE